MRTLAVFDKTGEYHISWPRLVFHSARAVICADSKIALLYCEKYDFYAFPGGKAKDGETLIDALIRETKEEAGLVIKPHTVREFGATVEIRKDLYAEGIYEQHDFYYTCGVEDYRVRQELSQSEKESGCRLAYVTFEEAIAKNESGPKYTSVATYVLKLLREAGLGERSRPTP